MCIRDSSSDGRKAMDATPAAGAAQSTRQAGFSQYEKPAVDRTSRKVASVRSAEQAQPSRERGYSNPRRQRVSQPDPVSYDKTSPNDGEMTYLDLPTFLRKQAD